MSGDTDRQKGLDKERVDGAFESVWHGYDAAQGEMLEELLRQEGFVPRLIGTRIAALIGMGQYTASLRIEVPSDSAVEARRVLKEFLNAPSEMEGVDSEDNPA